MLYLCLKTNVTRAICSAAWFVPNQTNVSSAWIIGAMGDNDRKGFCFAEVTA